MSSNGYRNGSGPSSQFIAEIRQMPPSDLHLLLKRYVQEACQGDAAAAEILITGVREGVKGPTVNTRQKPLAERIVDLADVQPPGDAPLLFGSYLLKGHAHWMTAQTGLGKTTLAYNLACNLAEGTPFVGVECQQTRVLYVDMESGDTGRALKIDRLYGDAERVRGHFLFLRESLRLPEELAALMEYVLALNIELVIFDTARRCFSVKDENDNAEVYNRIVPTLDALKTAGVASLTMGHPAKNGNGSARGAGAQEDAGDVNLSLTMHRGEITDTDGVIALRVTKNRLLGLGIPPLYLRRIGNDQFERLEAGEVDTVPMTTQRDKCREMVLTTLTVAAPERVTFDALLKVVGCERISKTTLHGILKDLQTELQITHAPRQGYALNDPFGNHDVEFVP